MMKKIMRAMAIIATVLVISVGYPAFAHAQGVAGETKISQFMSTLQKVDAKEEPDSNAATAFSYDVGASVLVTGETENGWYIVLYQGMTGYIDKDIAKDAMVVQEIDVAALDAEMEALQMEDKIIIEEVERYRAEKRRSRIWGTIIVLLVIAIFAVGIVSTVRVEKKKKENESIPEDGRENDIGEQEESYAENSEPKTYNGEIIDLDKE